MSELEHCPFCGSTTVRLNFKRRHNCFPKKVMGGGHVMRYSFQVHCKKCNAFGPNVITPYVPELESTDCIPSHMQQYADKAIHGWNSRVDKTPVPVQEEKQLYVKLADYRVMDKGVVYCYQDLLFYWDGSRLMYGDEGLDLKDWVELKETDFLFQKYMNKKLSRLSP